MIFFRGNDKDQTANISKIMTRGRTRSDCNKSFS